MENLNRIVIGSENGNSLAAKTDYNFSERITHNMEKIYCAVTGAYHNTAEHTKRAGYATIDRLVSEYKTRKDDATLLPFDYSTGMNYDSWSDKVYNHLQGILGSASKRVRNLINPYSGLLGPYSTVKAREHTQSKYKKGGFTLTELLVTISATALLMAILMPSLQRVRKEAKAVVCQTNLRQWGVKFEIDEKILLSSPSQLLRGFSIDGNQSFYAKDVRLCPMATKLGPPSSPVGYYGGKFFAWGYKDSNYGLLVASYGLNSMFSYNPLKLKTLLKNPSNVAVFFDCAIPWSGFWSSDNPPPQYDDMSIADANDNESLGRSFCFDRHDGGINMLFMDNSVRKVGLKELWTLKWHGDFKTTGPWTKAGGVKPEDWPKWMRKFKDY